MLVAQLMGQVNLTKSSVIQLKFAAAQDAPKVSELLDYRTMLGSSLTYCFNSSSVIINPELSSSPGRRKKPIPADEKIRLLLSAIYAKMAVIKKGGLVVG